jgi:hypothetical protein
VARDTGCAGISCSASCQAGEIAIGARVATAFAGLPTRYSTEASNTADGRGWSGSMGSDGFSFSSIRLFCMTASPE